MTENTGGPAFPPMHDPRNHDSGMNLLDYFAGQVLEGWEASISEGGSNPEAIAKYCYDRAAAMLSERRRRLGAG